MANFAFRWFDQSGFNVNKKIKDMQDGTYADVIAEQTIIFKTSQVLAVGASSVQSSAVGADTTRVILSTTCDCWVAVGSNPTAVANTAGSFFLSSGSQSYPIVVTAGSTKIAVIKANIDGYLSIIESA